MSAAKELRGFKSEANADSVLSFLRKSGFSVEQIKGIVLSYPMILKMRAERTLGPRIRFLEESVYRQLNWSNLGLCVAAFSVEGLSGGLCLRSKP